MCIMCSFFFILIILSVHSFLLPRLRCLNRSKSCIYFRCKRNLLASLKYPWRTTTVYGEYLFPQPLHPTNIRSVVRQTSVRFYCNFIYTALSVFNATGETTGRWLAHPNFVGKRIDVCVVPMQELTDIARRYPKLVSDGRINKTTYDRADAQKPGSLQPLDAKQQVRLKGLEWRRVKVKFPLGRDASMPVVTLRPCRTTYDGFHKETNKCISTAQGRVIIIGPDIDGCDGNIGEYAQTEPDADQLPSTFVNVKFARTRTDGRQMEQRHGRYHLHSLCRATNAPLPGFELICPPTDFEMDLST